MSELVSIVIVAHNNWPDLELAIESALNQSHRPLEVIVVDNDSGDQTPEIVPKRYAGRLAYLRQPNRGDAGGYNAGASAARGEFLLFLDGDDCLAPNLLDKEIALFRAEPDLDVVYGDVRQFQSRPGRAGFLDWDTGPTDDLLADIHEMGIMTQSSLLRRRVIERVGPFQESLYVADYEFWLRAAWAGCRFRYCPGALAFYRSRPGQMSADTPAMLRGIGEVWERALAYVDREPHRAALRARLAQRRFYLALADRRTSARAALASLARARAIHPGAIAPLAYVLGCLIVLTPGGRSLMHARPLAWLRGRLSRLFGFY
ncbi:MAG TPA: glycosyltransferase [Chloroflexota bacterium]